jgi:hypothetical protein
MICFAASLRITLAVCFLYFPEVDYATKKPEDGLATFSGTETTGTVAGIRKSPRRRA